MPRGKGDSAISKEHNHYLNNVDHNLSGGLSDTELVIAECVISFNNERSKAMDHLKINRGYFYSILRKPTVITYINERIGKISITRNVTSIDGILKELNTLYNNTPDKDIQTKREILKDIANHRKVFKDGVDEFTMKLQSMDTGLLISTARGLMKDIEQTSKLLDWNNAVINENDEVEERR